MLPTSTDQHRRAARRRREAARLAARDLRSAARHIRAYEARGLTAFHEVAALRVLRDLAGQLLRPPTTAEIVAQPTPLSSSLDLRRALRRLSAASRVYRNGGGWRINRHVRPVR